MTHLDAKFLLESCGLKTDIESIRRRIKNMNYYADISCHKNEADLREPYKTWDELIDDLEAADLLILCSFARKGERADRLFTREIKRLQNRIDSLYSRSWDFTIAHKILDYVLCLKMELDDFIFVTEGESK